jgi:hypothetical protein
MIAANEGTPIGGVRRVGATWRKLGVLFFAIVAIGLPVNHLAVYAPLALLTVIVFSGDVSASARAWLAAIAVIAVAVAGQTFLAPPRIDEGHNVFLPGGPTLALKKGLPADVYNQLATEFDQKYPPDRHCEPEEIGCWRGMGFPDGPFAFSADGIFHKSDMSRSVTGINFSDPVWLRLGFINEYRYNWYPVSDVQRATGDAGPWGGFHRWQLTMPWFETIRLPAAYAGGELCWQGELMWEEAAEHFVLLQGDRCRTIKPADSGRRVVGLAITPESLSMRLSPPWPVRLLQLAQGMLIAGALVGLMLILVSVKARALIVPFVLIGLSVLVIAIDDSSFLGGMRPLDSGDDGLFYDGIGRTMLQSLLNGDYSNFLIGGEKVFYYGGPGLRYFRAFEHIIFGESFLGYLSLILVMPFLVYALFRRFLSPSWALGLGIIFVVIPIGHVFGTTFGNYVEWAERGFADPAAYILFIAGLLPILGARPTDDSRAKFLQSDDNFALALLGALLIVLGICMKPLIAPAAAVFLGGAGLAAIYWRQWRRLAGLCVGILPVFSMALHNWVFGHVFVLFSTNATHPLVLNMPPAAYADALRELVTLNFTNRQFERAVMKIPEWLSSAPRQSFKMVPFNAISVAILVYVVFSGRRFDSWLRLIGAAAIAQHLVALFYVPLGRYHYLTWFLTMLVLVVFIHEIGIDWLLSRFRNSSQAGSRAVVGAREGDSDILLEASNRKTN